MPATTGYQAAPETSDTLISYAAEAVYGTKPAVAFQAIRYMSETLGSQKQRARPSEINTSGEVSQATTTQEAATGDVNFALSFKTFDDLISGALNADWQDNQNIAGVDGDITITNASGVVTLTSTTAGKFANITAGQFIRTLGFTNTGNNGFWHVVEATGDTSLTLAGVGVAVTETPAAAAAQIRASTIVNGTEFHSFFLQNRFSPELYLQYPGSFVSAFTLSGGTGQFLQGKFSFMSMQEQSATVDGSTGAVLPAPTGGVHDPVSGFVGVLLNDATIGAAVDSFEIDVQATNAKQVFAMGSASAQGQTRGLLQATGKLKMLFKNFDLYSRFKSEEQARLSFITRDPSGNAYVVTLLNAALMNPSIDSSGPGEPVYAEFDLEGNPQPGGGTIQIDRLPAQ